MKDLYKNALLLGILISGLNVSFGQISQGGTPYSFQILLKNKIGSSSVELKKDIPLSTMPNISKYSIDEIKKQNKIQGLYQFAYGFDVDIDIKTFSVIDSLDNGLLYRFSIESKGAKSINLIFKKYILPKGAKLFLYNKGGENTIGAFSSNNNKISERLPILPVYGDEVTIEYFEPYFPEFIGKLILGRVNHDFIGVVSKQGEIDDDFGSSAPCMVDVNCSEGSNWQNEKRSVCRIVKNGNSLCTGTMLNNTNNDGRPYFLTANHCISAQHDADDCIFIFNYESPSCYGSDGSTSQSISGAQIRATSHLTDFTLLELSHEPLSTWNPYYAGWDRNDNQGAGGVGIHHPQGDVKKISTYEMIPFSSDCIAGFPQNNFYLIDNWISTPNGHGITESGSSGSALFNSNHHVIGQLYGKCPDISTCDEPANAKSNYGKIFSSWNSGGSPSNQLQNWLDPSNGNIFTLDGASVCPQETLEQLSLTQTVNSGLTETYLAGYINSTSTIKSGATAIYEAFQSIELEPGFHAEVGSDFVATMKTPLNCLPGCYPMSLKIVNFLFSTGGNLCFNQINAQTYSLELQTLSGQIAYQSAGVINSYMVCVSIPNNLGAGSYIVTLTLNSNCEELSETYSVVNTGGSSGMGQNPDTIYTNQMLKSSLGTKEKFESDKFDFEIFPNPNNGEFTLTVQAELPIEYSLEIISSVGVIVYRIETINELKIKLNQLKLPKGIYCIRVMDREGFALNKKIVIQ